jgi:hypothetical protein
MNFYLTMMGEVWGSEEKNYPFFSLDKLLQKKLNWIEFRATSHLILDVLILIHFRGFGRTSNTDRTRTKELTAFYCRCERRLFIYFLSRTTVQRQTYDWYIERDTKYTNTQTKCTYNYFFSDKLIKWCEITHSLKLFVGLVDCVVPGNQ